MSALLPQVSALCRALDSSGACKKCHYKNAYSNIGAQSNQTRSIAGRKKITKLNMTIHKLLKQWTCLSDNNHGNVFKKQRMYVFTKQPMFV